MWDPGPKQPANGLILRSAHRCPSPGGLIFSSLLEGSTYESTVLDWLPSYLRLYRALSKRDTADKALDYLDGLLSNCALALMALDRLAAHHFAEDESDANNATIREQRYESTLLLVSVFAALESLTWAMVTLSGARPHRRRDVYFNRLLKQSTETKKVLWTGQVESFCPSAVSALRSGVGPSLELARHFRNLLEHYVPLPVATAVFGEPSPLPPRFLDRLNVGALPLSAKLT